MKTIVFCLSAVLLMTAACTDNPTDPMESPGYSAIPTVTVADRGGTPGVIERITGSGHYTSPPISNSPNMRRVFTMNALKMADGTVKGNFNLRLHVPGGDPPDLSGGTITCFTVIGNVAWIGGHLDGADPPDVVWQVVDNGQGKQAEPDLLGLTFGPFNFPTLFDAGFAQDFCDQTPDGFDFGVPYGWVPLSALNSAVEDGNITIDVR